MVLFADAIGAIIIAILLAVVLCVVKLVFMMFWHIAKSLYYSIKYCFVPHRDDGHRHPRFLVFWIAGLMALSGGVFGVYYTVAICHESTSWWFLLHTVLIICGLRGISALGDDKIIEKIRVKNPKYFRLRTFFGGTAFIVWAGLYLSLMDLEPEWYSWWKVVICVLLISFGLSGWLCAIIGACPMEPENK